MPTDLPDINVWIALADRDHPHHRAAREYWASKDWQKVAFCRLTMLGFLRIGSNRTAMTGRPFTPAEAWAAYRTLRSLSDVVFLEEPEGIEPQMAQWSERDDFPNRQWTDCFLAAFAKVADCRLVSFDQGFAAFEGINFLRLS